MLQKIKIALALSTFLGMWHTSNAQQNDPNSWGELHGNFQTDAQYYFRDLAIDSTGEFYPAEKLLAAGFANFIYTKGNFSAGLRYENYQNNLLGLPEGFRGEGIPFRFLRYEKDGLDITVGNYYEQFGSGMIFRSFEERGLGLDNAMDGVRLRYQPIKGLYLKAFVGRQRLYFGKTNGIVRGVDAEWNLNESIEKLQSSKWFFTIGTSFVSKFETANDPFLNLPQNVGAHALRLQIQRGGFNWTTEYVGKINDPSADNGYIFRNGTGFLSTLTYSQKGLGILVSVKRLDDMSFRSNRAASLIDAQINFLPPTTKLHTYALPALYPYAVQPTGEMGAQLELSYTFQRGSILGGKYGTTVAVNYSDAHSIDRQFIEKRPVFSAQDPTQVLDSVRSGTKGYNSNPFRVGPIKYFSDFNLEIRKTLSKKTKLQFTYYNFEYNQEVLEKGIRDEEILFREKPQQLVYVNAFVLDVSYKIKKGHTLRTELQGMFTRQDRGDWALILMEYSISPNWFFAVQDAWNFGNPNESDRLHYVLGSFGYLVNTTRFQINYGRQMRGIFCVGGICRVVPPSNGISLSITSNF